MGIERGDYGFSLNGRAVSFAGEAPQTTLLDFIRAQGLTGAKEGCAEGECGACAVLLGSRAVNSCLIPLPAAVGFEVTTVEALGAAGLQQVQRAMTEFGGSQCGYCTPGFVISMFAEHCRAGSGQADMLALGGNLCRCTGYRPIRDAMGSLGTAPQRLGTAAPMLGSLNYITGKGRFSRPANLAECLKRGEDPCSRFVAGNTDLGINTNLRGERYPHLVSVAGIAEMRFFSETRDTIEIGASLTLSELAEKWTDAPAMFHEWIQLFASVLIRNRATLGGSLATASPIGDSAPLLLALDAEVLLLSRGGERVVPLNEFFTAYRQTALQRGEVLYSIRIPKPLPEFIRFYKVAKRRMDDISTVAAAIATRRDAAGRVESARVALGGVAPTPWRARETERILEGTTFGPSDLKDAQESLRRTLKPIGDHRGSAAYRLAMAQSLLGKFRQEVAA